MYKDNLLVENAETFNSSKITSKKEITDNISVSHVELNRKEAKIINKNKGKYSTIFFNKKAITHEIEALIDITLKELKKR